MNEIEKVSSKNRESIESYIKTELRANKKKLKNKYPPISELVDGTNKILKIIDFYELKEEFKNYYFIKVKNYLKSPKMRYFLAITLASQSSDFLVALARDILRIELNIKLIQFSIYPKHNRVSLLALKEVRNKEVFLSSIKLLKDLRFNFRKSIDRIKNLIGNI